MNTKNNQRTRLSKMLLKNALMDLLKENGSVEKISVRELCSVAELNRSTFYAHYNEPKDLLNEIENELLDSTEQHLERIGQEDDMGAHRYILSFLKYIKSNDKQNSCSNQSFSSLSTFKLNYPMSLNNIYSHIF